jgi:excisionase family DNA binding protein
MKNNVSMQSPLDNYKDLLSVENLAEIFETTKNTIYKEIQRGKFGSPIKIGRKYRIPKTLVREKFFKD